jgi:hypothetical protein
LLYVEDAEAGPTFLDAYLAEEMRSEEPRVDRPGEKYLGVGKVYVFAGTDEWEQFRDQVQEASRLLEQGASESGKDMLRKALAASDGLA